MNIAICDDERYCRTELDTLLSRYARLRETEINVYAFDAGTALLKAEQHFDLIFMDYQMDRLNGLDTARRLREKEERCAIIFLTSYPEVVYDCFEVSAYRFLIKPVDSVKLFRALDDYRVSLETAPFLLIREDGIDKRLDLKEVLYFEADGKNVLIRTADSTHHVSCTLKALCSQFHSDLFFRIHRSFVVNFEHIRSCDGDKLTLSNGECAKISKYILRDFKDAYRCYVRQHAF